MINYVIICDISRLITELRGLTHNVIFLMIPFDQKLITVATNPREKNKGRRFSPNKSS